MSGDVVGFGGYLMVGAALGAYLASGGDDHDEGDTAAGFLCILLLWPLVAAVGAIIGISVVAKHMWSNRSRTLFFTEESRLVREKQRLIVQRRMLRLRQSVEQERAAYAEEFDRYIGGES